MKIGIFDSGIGGEAVSQSLAKEFPEAELVVVNDKQNVPYGSKTVEEIKRLTNTAIQPLLAARCDIVVIACNSATAAAIDWLREIYPNQLFIGLEPMVKPASEQTKTGIISVCATPATLASDNYQKLKDTFASDIHVIEPDVRHWASLIEENSLGEEEIANTVKMCIEQGADVIVLGCTHYHWIKDYIVSLVPTSTAVLEPSSAIAKRVRQLLSERTASTN